MNLDNISVFDVETSTINKGHPFDPRNILVSYALVHDASVWFNYYTDPGFLTNIRSVCSSDNTVVGFNVKFDLHWLQRAGVSLHSGSPVWDCQLAEFVYSGQENSYVSLDSTYEEYGLNGAKDHTIEEFWAQGISTENIPVHIVEARGRSDVVPLKELYEIQQGLLNEKQKTLVLLMGEDLKSLQAAEYAGIKFDVEGARKRINDITYELEQICNELGAYLPDDIPSGTFNWNSGDHLSAFLYGGTISFDWFTESEAVYKSGQKKGESYIKRSWHSTDVVFPKRFNPLEGSEVKKTSENPDAVTRFYQTDAPTLSQLRAKTKVSKEILSLLNRRAKRDQVSTMLTSILKKMETMNWQDNYIHGQFNQNVAITGRLSSSGPNLQNAPEEIDEFFVSRYDT